MQTGDHRRGVAAYLGAACSRAYVRAAGVVLPVSMVSAVFASSGSTAALQCTAVLAAAGVGLALAAHPPRHSQVALLAEEALCHSDEHEQEYREQGN
jgi:hypothetical protein